MGKKENETQKVSIHTDGEEEMNTNMSRREEMFHRQTPWGATWETEGGWERREVFGRSNGGVALPQTVNNSQFCLLLEKILPLHPQISLPDWRVFNLDAEPQSSVILCVRLQLMILELAEVEIQILSEALKPFVYFQYSHHDILGINLWLSCFDKVSSLFA